MYNDEIYVEINDNDVLILIKNFPNLLKKNAYLYNRFIQLRNKIQLNIDIKDIIT